jgi:3-hydroxyisobutyrate dehydrogenase
MKIAFFGAGLMGAGFVRRARANGLEVNVWNRSAAKARALEADGVKAFADAAAALAGVERIHLSLADDASVDAVLEPLASAIPAGTWIVDHTTTAVRPTAERAARWDGRGRVFVHAPVFMAPQNAHDGTGLMLVSGPKARHDGCCRRCSR